MARVVTLWVKASNPVTKTELFTMHSSVKLVSHLAGFAVVNP